MPFSARVVDNREDIPDIFQGNAVKVLEKAHVSNMIGLLLQLNQVSKYASEVFQDILKDAEKNSTRISECKQRISRIDSKVAPIEKMFVERAPSYFYDNPYTGSEWKRRDALKGLIFRRDRSSMEVNRRRNEADPPPNFSVLDPYSKVPCIKNFTDSNFFMNEWMEAEKKKIEQEKLKRKERKKRKKKKRQEKTTIQALKRKIYDKNTGKMIEVKDSDVLVKQYTLTDAVNGPVDFGGDDDEKGRIPGGSQAGAVHHARGGSISARGRGRGAPPPNPVANAGPGQPPPVPGGGMNGGGPPVFKPPVFNPVGDDNKEDIGPKPPVFKPPIFNPAMQAKIKNNGDISGDVPGGADGPPPPNPYEMEQEPIQERLTGAQMAMLSAQVAERNQVMSSKPAIPGGGKKMDFLNSIKQGTSLRKAETVKREVPKDKRSILMSALRDTGKKTLKKIDPSKIQKKEVKKPENEGIFAILNRRQLMADDSDSDESGSSADWTDED